MSSRSPRFPYRMCLPCTSLLVSTARPQGYKVWPQKLHLKLIPLKSNKLIETPSIPLSLVVSRHRFAENQINRVDLQPHTTLLHVYKFTFDRIDQKNQHWALENVKTSARFPDFVAYFIDPTRYLWIIMNSKEFKWLADWIGNLINVWVFSLTQWKQLYTCWWRQKKA